MSKPLKRIPTTDSVAALLALGEALEGRQAVHFCDKEHDDLPETVDDNVALLVESSGSTGQPQLYYLSAEAVLASARATEKVLGGPGQWLLCLPLQYIAGIQVLVRSLIADTQPVLTNTSMPFTAEGFARAASMMRGERLYTSLVPAQLSRLATAAGSDDFVLAQMRRFDAILVGGQAPNPNLIHFLRELGVKVVVTYGATETSGGCVYDGEPLPGVGIEILPDGRVAVSGPTLANNVGEKWESSDLGEIDAEGKLHILGRMDRVINSGGIKLSLDWVEQWVRAHEQVADVVVMALEHKEFGQSFCGFVVYKTENFTPINREEAEKQFGVIAKNAVWASLEAIPQLPNGKPDIYFLKQSFMDYQEYMKGKEGDA